MQGHTWASTSSFLLRLVVTSILAVSFWLSVTSGQQQEGGQKGSQPGSTQAPPKRKARVGIPQGFPVPWPVNSEELEKARLRKGSLSSDQGGVRNPGAPEVPMLERGARRYALIVANEKYMELEPLQTPRLEAEALLDVLAANGFITQIHYDLGLSDFRAAVSRFSQGLQSKDFVLFYYAGHAVEVQGNNYLLPVTFKKSDHDIVGAEGYRLDEIRSLLGRNDRNSLVIVDACRISPFGGRAGTASTSKHIGSNPLKPSNHEGIVFSTSEQQVAYDGAGWQRSPFSRAVTYAFRQSEQGIKTAVSLARAIVVFTSQGLQVPQIAFGDSFPDARISAFEHPTGFASTPVREFVHFSPERIRLEVREFAKRKGLPVQPIGVDAEASGVLTSKQKWVVRHHADQTAWETSEKEQAINFLESRLDVSGLKQADKELWEEIKSSQEDENIVWLLEEVAFRDVGLPALFEAIPEADKMLLRDKDVRSVGIVGHAVLDFLDANNIRTLRWADENLSAIEEIPIWKPRLRIDETQRWGSSFTVEAMTPIRTRLATLGQACAAISLPEDSDACQRLLEAAQHDKMPTNERRLLTLLFHQALTHGIHFSQWLAASLRPGWEAKQKTFSDALSALGHSRLTSAVAVYEFFENLDDSNCGELRKSGPLLPLDKLDGAARLVDAVCGAQWVPWMQGTKYYKEYRAVGSGVLNDLTTIRNMLNTDERSRIALGAQALTAQKEERDGEEFAGIGIVEALRTPVVAKALTDCRPSSAWSTVSRDTYVARSTEAWEGTARDRFVGGGWTALALFDPGAARFQFAAEKSIVSRLPDVRIEDGDKELMCFADIIQGESSNCSSLVTTYIRHELIKALWSALDGRWKEMDEFMASAKKYTLEYKEREKNEASTAVVSEELMSQLNDLTIFARRLRGESVPGKLGQDWAGPLSLFSHCGMPPEIR